MKALPVNVSFLMSLEDYKQYKLYLQQKRYDSLLRYLAPVGCPLLLVWMALSLWAAGEIQIPMVGGFLLWIAALILFKDMIFPALVSFGAKGEFEAIKESLESKSLLLAEGILQVKTVYGESRYPLSRLYRIEETQGLFVFALGPNQCEILPKRTLNQQEIAFLQTTIAQTAA